jgi:hypothetical protein
MHPSIVNQAADFDANLPDIQLLGEQNATLPPIN